jgi:Fe-S oxidoreductase
MTVQGIVLLAMFLGVLSAFALILRMLVRSLRLGKPEDRFDHWGERIWSVIVYVGAQARVLAQPAGLGHFIIFYGFIFITLGTFEHIGGLIFPGFSYASIFGASVAGIISFFQDVLGLLVLGAIIVSLFRRFVLKPLRLRIDDPKAKQEAVFILGLIFVLILLMFGIKGEGILMDPPKVDKAYAPVSAIAARLLEGKGDPYVLESVFAWTHHMIIFFFLIYIPFSKHIHILGAIPNIFFRNLGPTGSLSRMDFEDESADKFGNSEVTDFTWKQLLDLYACTECGRCQAVCPAYLTEKPLSPFRMIHMMRGQFVDERKGLLKRGDKADGGDKSDDGDKAEVASIIGKTMTPDEIWACTTCGACVQECPPFIEHVQKIVDMRRYLVMTESSFPHEMQPVFRNMEVNYNPWSMGFSTRADWAEGLDVPIAAEKKEFDILFWVGCAGSFDARGQSIAKAMVKILKSAGVDFAILGVEEMCCGETARRMGNEYLAQTLIEANIENLKKYRFNRILTTCPHGFNTFSVEYPQFGYKTPVVHHSQFLLELVEEGKLDSAEKIEGKVNRPKGVYHDSCYLGRYNGIFDEPRKLIARSGAGTPAEFGRRGKRSFCCGAGGGRMWMEETIGKRINEERVDEALALGVDTIYTACPFCMTMFEDGLKAREKEAAVKVRDIAELF